MRWTRGSITLPSMNHKTILSWLSVKVTERVSNCFSVNTVVRDQCVYFVRVFVCVYLCVWEEEKDAKL